MRPSKRFREEEEDIQIRVAAGEPLGAESYVLRTFSSCARALPVDAAEWDVSGLLFDGHPFSHETVSCWLNCAQHLVEGCAELGAQNIQHLSTVAGLTQVLAFADAVGSRSSLRKVLCNQVPELKLVVQLPEQVLELPVAGYQYGFSLANDKQLLQFSLQQSRSVGKPLASAEQRLEVQQQVAKQLSAMLQLAHVQGMQLLIDMLHAFTLLNVRSGQWFLLSGVESLVFTEAVLEAASTAALATSSSSNSSNSNSSSSTLSKEAYVSSVLSEPCGLKPGAVGYSSLLKPVQQPNARRAYDTYNDTLVFDAELLRDFAGGRAGDKVKVTLDLFNAEHIRLQFPASPATTKSVTLPAQLLLGSSFTTAAALDEFLKANPA